MLYVYEWMFRVSQNTNDIRLINLMYVQKMLVLKLNNKK